MAHVLVGMVDKWLSDLVDEVLTEEGHAVTVARRFWDALGVLRTSLHPLVVICVYDGSMADVPFNDEQMAALVTNSAALRQHAYVQISWHSGQLPPRLQALAEQVACLGTIPGPFHLEPFIELVNTAAERVGAAPVTPASHDEHPPLAPSARDGRPIVG
jgi:hypothetical protein